ncbi:MAG: hypothetical protein H7259_05990 [Cytophagales bacterium]|nr:hypothetical protein [Cytophaga sp.]
MVYTFIEIVSGYIIGKLSKRKRVIIAVVFVFISVASIYFNWNKYEDRKERNTMDEMYEIKNDITAHKDLTGELPVALIEIIRKNPLKSGCLSDGWDKSIYIW